MIEIKVIIIIIIISNLFCKFKTLKPIGGLEKQYSKYLVSKARV